jgi:anti-sigma factor RsiW
MTPSIQQLDDQAILLLYLTDELTPDDRAAVEARLAAEENLRAELDNLRSAHDSVARGLAALDAQQPLRAGVEPAQRDLVRQIKQWQTRRLAGANAGANRTARRRGMYWLVPFCGAAAALFAVIIWWGSAANPQLPPEDNIPRLGSDPTALPVSLQLDSRDNSLAEAEQEMDALSDLRSHTR